MAQRISIIIFVIALAAAYAVYQKTTLESQLVTESKSEAVLARLPRASFETLDGKEFSLDQLYATSPKLVMVHFWGTWCAPCEAELPELLKLIKRYEKETKVHFLLVATNDEVIKIQKHLKTLALPNSPMVHWLLDNKNVHRDLFGTSRVPETFVFSSDKMTLRKYVGPQEWSKTMFFQTFDDFMQLSSSSL